MRKGVDIFHANKWYKLAVVVIFISILQSKNLWYIFQTIFSWKLSFISHETNDTVFSPGGPVFSNHPFFSGSIISQTQRPGRDPVYTKITIYSETLGKTKQNKTNKQTNKGIKKKCFVTRARLSETFFKLSWASVMELFCKIS